MTTRALTTVLSHHAARIKTVRPLHPTDPLQGVVVQAWTRAGGHEIQLDATELHTFLTALSQPLLLKALAAQGWSGAGPVPDCGCPMPGTFAAELCHVAQQQLCAVDAGATDCSCDCHRRPVGNGADNPFFGLDAPQPCEER